jgi:hypothetical protein
MLRKILRLSTFLGLSLVMFISIAKADDTLPSCIDLYYKCYNSGTIQCKIYADKALYNPKEQRTNIMNNAVDTCNIALDNHHVDGSDGACQVGLDVIMDAKNPRMCAWDVSKGLNNKN